MDSNRLLDMSYKLTQMLSKNSDRFSTEEISSLKEVIEILSNPSDLILKKSFSQEELNLQKATIFKVICNLLRFLSDPEIIKSITDLFS